MLTYETYSELLAACEKHGFKLVPKDEPKMHNFTVIARFERGVGPEYVNLKPVVATTIQEAYKLADEQAASYFMENGMRDAIINQVRIRPNDN